MPPPRHAGFARFAGPSVLIRLEDFPNFILRLWCQPTFMKIIFGLAIALVVVNQWDQNYNHGTLTRAGFSLARALGQSFGI